MAKQKKREESHSDEGKLREGDKRRGKGAQLEEDKLLEEDGRLRQELKGLLQAVEAAGQASLPVSNDALLRSIVEAAAKIFQAAAASILLVDESEGALVFKVATGAADQDLVGMRVPLDQGIAGYVAMTGQPIAISDVEHDARFNRDFARSTGYVPRSILAMPLISGERILGVMEVLDKIDAPSFGMQDMELLGMFARQAALAIEMSQGLERLGETLVSGLKWLARSPAEGAPGELLALFEEAPGAAEQEDLRKLAALFNDFNRLGEEERKTALKVLAAFAEYAQTRRKPGRGVSWR
jgi:GAF domain-containing protein